MLLEVYSLQLGENLEFNCITDDCGNTVQFGIFDISKAYITTCSKCGAEYKFDKDLLRKIMQFENLCRVITQSEEILSETHVSIDVAGHNVKIPFRLLMTRLNSQLDLDINGKQLKIKFRLMPFQSTVNAAFQEEALKVQSG